MIAWPAALEQRHVALVDGLLGLAMLVVALVVIDDLLAWLGVALLAAIIAVLDVTVKRRVRRRLDPAELPGLVTASPGRTLLRRTLPHLAGALVGSVLLPLVILSFAPVFCGLFAVLLFASAANALGRAAVIARFERGHAARVVRTGGHGDDDRFYLAH